MNDYETELLAYLGDVKVTDDQHDAIISVWKTLEGKFDTDDPSYQTASNAAVEWILGDSTLKELGGDLMQAERKRAEAMDRLTGAIIAASESGMNVTDIAKQSGVTRQTVYTKLGD